MIVDWLQVAQAGLVMIVAAQQWALRRAYQTGQADQRLTDRVKAIEQQIERANGLLSRLTSEFQAMPDRYVLQRACDERLKHQAVEHESLRKDLDRIEGRLDKRP